MLVVVINEEYLCAGADPGLRSQAGVTVVEAVAEHSPAMAQLLSDELLRAVAASDTARVSQLLEAGVSREVGALISASK